MSLKRYQLCTRCVMDTSDPEITFDREGRCNHCSDYLELRAAHQYQGEQSDLALARVLEEIKRAGRGKPYDCIVGLSGGIDSSYVAYLVKQFGLRPLAVHIDNGWDSEESITNIRNVVSKLDIDYESYVLDWEEFRELQLAFLRASVPEAETPTDMAIPAAQHYYAAKYGVRHLISGGNLATEGILPKSWHYNARDLKYFDHIHRTFGTGRLRNFPKFDYKREMYLKLVKGIKTIYVLDQVPYSQKDAVNVLSDKIDFRVYGGKHHESTYTRFIQSFYLFEKFGIDYRRATLSSLICCGQVGRDEALSKLENKPYDPSRISDDKEYIAKKLRISPDELEKIVRGPAKWYWDYPNDDVKLGRIYWTYRKLFKKEKLASV